MKVNNTNAVFNYKSVAGTFLCFSFCEYLSSQSIQANTNGCFPVAFIKLLSLKAKLNQLLATFHMVTLVNSNPNLFSLL